MPAVTIGVPVYNAGEFLNECLECLAAQTFPDFEALIYDNASTDNTASIARDWAAKDVRFLYFRQPENRGATQNFLDVLNAARSEYFMWRAYDDLSAVNFLEVTHRLLSSESRAKLAVGTVRKFAIDGTPKRDSPVPNLNVGPRLFRIRRALRGYHPSWFYGLWRREAALETFRLVWLTNPGGWGFDHLTLILLSASDALATSNETYFVQRKRKVNTLPADVQGDRLRSDFTDQCNRMLGEQPMNAAERAVVRAMIALEIRRLFKPRKLKYPASPQAVER